MALEFDHQHHPHHRGQTREAGAGGWAAPWQIPHLLGISDRRCARVMEAPQIQLHCQDFLERNPVQYKYVFFR